MSANQHKKGHEHVARRPLSLRRQDWLWVLRTRTLHLTVKGEGGLDRIGAGAEMMAAG